MYNTFICIYLYLYNYIKDLLIKKYFSNYLKIYYFKYKYI